MKVMDYYILKNTSKIIIGKTIIEITVENSTSNNTNLDETPKKKLQPLKINIFSNTSKNQE